MDPAIHRRGSSTIKQFCSRHQLSHTTYFAMRKAGLGPKEIRVGRVVRISDDADDEWVKRAERTFSIAP